MTPPDSLPATHSLATFLQALTPAARLDILLAIGAGEACVCHLEAHLGLRQAYISQHLMALREAGLITSRRSGRYVYYRLAQAAVLDFLQQAARIAGVQLSAEPVLPLADCPCPACSPAQAFITADHLLVQD